MRFLLAFALAAAATAQPLQFVTLKEDVLVQRLHLAHPRNPERYQRLKKLFSDGGCSGEVYSEQRVPSSKEPNMICQLAGAPAIPGRIIVGAHFDAVGGEGVIDNWSGAVLLPTLFECLQRVPRRHQFEFVAFAAEEKGLLGSQAFLKSIPKSDRKQIAAVIIMDSLGLTPTKCWVHGSSKELVNAASAVAASLKLDFSGVNVDQVGTTDSQPFKDANIPVLCLHSVTQETWKLINGPQDVWKVVSWRDYYDSYRLITVLLAYLDRTLP